MRIPVLATLLSLSLVACAGNISGGGGDDDVPESCGDGQLDQGEACDDNNNTDGDGCSAACTIEASPRLDLTVDKPTITTELATTNMVTITLTGSDGFSGSVNLTGSVVDGTNTVMPDWIVAINPPTVNVPLDGSATAVATFAVPSRNLGLAGTLKISSTSSTTTGTLEASSVVTVENQITFSVTSNNGQCVYPTDQAISVSEGTKVRFLNKGTIDMIIHSDGNSYGVAHQNVNTTIGTDVAYEQTISAGTADGSSFTWYCHAPGPNLGGGNPKILVTQ